MSVVPQARAEFDLGSALDETKMRAVGEYLSGYSIFSRLRGCGMFGNKFHFEVGAHATLGKLGPLRDALGPPNNEGITGSIIGVPKVVLRAGYHYLMFGASFIPAVTIQGASIEILGGEMVFYVGDWLKLPMKVDVRGHIGQIKLGYKTTLSTVYFSEEVGVKIGFGTMGLSLGMSKPLGTDTFNVEPYLSAGLIQRSADYGEAAAIAGWVTDTDVPNKYSKTGFHGTVGVSINFFTRFSIAFELDRIDKLYLYSFGFNVRFK